jgi:hypothetical protein
VVQPAGQDIIEKNQTTQCRPKVGHAYLFKLPAIIFFPSLDGIEDIIPSNDGINSLSLSTIGVQPSGT